MTKYLNKEGFQNWVDELICYYQTQRGSALCDRRVADAAKSHGAWIVLQDIKFELDVGAHDIEAAE